MKIKKPDILIVGAGPVGCVITERCAKIKKWSSIIINKKKTKLNQNNKKYIFKYVS